MSFLLMSNTCARNRRTFLPPLQPPAASIWLPGPDLTLLPITLKYDKSQVIYTHFIVQLSLVCHPYQISKANGQDMIVVQPPFID